MGNTVNPRINLGAFGLIFTALAAFNQAYNGIQAVRDISSGVANKVSRAFATIPKPLAFEAASEEQPLPSDPPPINKTFPGENILERTGEMAQALFASAYDKTAEFASFADQKIGENLPLGVSAAWNWTPSSVKIGGSIVLAFWLLGIWPFGQRVKVTQNVIIHTYDQEVTTSKKSSGDVDVKVSPKRNLNKKIQWSPSDLRVLNAFQTGYQTCKREAEQNSQKRSGRKAIEWIEQAGS
jgi:hypothetical protein